jgi:DNA (cytosine-5)-methyltransferase 1
VLHLDLFSGIGGFALAARWAGIETVAFCESDEFCKSVLAKHWPGVPVIEDVRLLDGRNYKGVDLLTGGFPCQPFSEIGERKGAADDRYLWPEMRRIVAQARPAWVVAENVPGIVGMALDDVLSDLEAEGYATQALVIPACGVGANHRRDRVWIVANATGEPLRVCGQPRQDAHSWDAEPGVARVANGIPGALDRNKALGNAIVPQVAYELLRTMATYNP